MVTGRVPLINDFELPSSRFFVDEDCSIPDNLADDQAMYFDADGDTVVLLGCAPTSVTSTCAN